MYDDDYVAVSSNSPMMGDYIVDSDGNQYRVDGIDYVNCMVDAVNKENVRYNFAFSGFESGEFKKVVN